MAPEPTKEQISQLSEALFRGRKIEAIKIYKEATGLGLKEAKDAVDALEADLRARHPGKFAAAKGKGCLGPAALFCLCAGLAAGAWWVLLYGTMQ
jgi:hypothetical protein